MDDILTPLDGVGSRLSTAAGVAALNGWRTDAAGEERSDGTTDEVAQLRQEIEHLHRAMAGRAVIEQAKGILMLRYGCNADAAFTGLVSWSQTRNVKLRVVADALVLTISTGEPNPDLDTDLVRWLEQRLREGLPDAAGRTAPEGTLRRSSGVPA